MAVPGERGHRQGGEFRVGEQTGRPARHDLVHPGAPGVHVHVVAQARVGAGDPVEPRGAAGARHAEQGRVHRRRVPEPRRDRHGLPGLHLAQGGGERAAGGGEGAGQPLGGRRDDRGEICLHCRAVRRGSGILVVDGNRRFRCPDVIGTSSVTWSRPHRAGPCAPRRRSRFVPEGPGTRPACSPTDPNPLVGPPRRDVRHVSTAGSRASARPPVPAWFSGTGRGRRSGRSAT